MSELSDVEERLKRQEADYLRRLKASGELPLVIAEAWKKAGGKETEALRGKEATLLSDYVKSGAEAREKYKDIWDPFARGTLVAQERASAYKPIGDIRAELAARAEALGIATKSSAAMFQAGTERLGTGIEFTKSAYERAWAKEQEATRQRERAEDIARAKKSGGGGGGGSKASSKTSSKKELESYLADVSSTYRDMPWEQMVKESKEAGIDPVYFRDAIFRQALDAYGDVLPESTIRSLVYKNYFPDGWR